MKKSTISHTKIYFMLLLLLGFGSNQRAKAQIIIGELGYSPLGVFTNDIGITQNVITLGANVMNSSTKMIGLTLDYSMNKIDIDDNVNDFFGTEKVAKLTYKGSLIRSNYTRYVFLVGELDVPFQCFLTGGYSLGYETRSITLNNKDIFTESELTELNDDHYGFANRSYIHMQFILGAGLQYNFTRNIGLRCELNYGTGVSNTEEYISGSLMPKLSLCYKPDYIFR